MAPPPPRTDLSPLVPYLFVDIQVKRRTDHKQSCVCADGTLQQDFDLVNTILMFSAAEGFFFPVRCHLEFGQRVM